MDKEKTKATAKFNMTFDIGSFLKDHSYFYTIDKNIVHVIDEKGKSQDFLFSEFDIFFNF